MQQIILAITGKPGLYKLVSRGKNNLIVEALDATHRRMPAFSTDRITSLNDITMFTETDDVLLTDVLDNLKTLEGGKKASINEKKASGSELQEYFSKVLPEWDRDRVHTSDIKKLISWYNILVENGITDFKDEEEQEAEALAEEAPAAVEEAPAKAPAKKATTTKKAPKKAKTEETAEPAEEKKVKRTRKKKEE